MATAKKATEKTKMVNMLKRDGFRLPHGYELIVRKKRKKAAKKKTATAKKIVRRKSTKKRKR